MVSRDRSAVVPSRVSMSIFLNWNDFFLHHNTLIIPTLSTECMRHALVLSYFRDSPARLCILPIYIIFWHLLVVSLFCLFFPFLFVVFAFFFF